MHSQRGGFRSRRRFLTLEALEDRFLLSASNPSCLILASYADTPAQAQVALVTTPPNDYANTRIASADTSQTTSTYLAVADDEGSTATEEGVRAVQPRPPWMQLLPRAVPTNNPARHVAETPGRVVPTPGANFQASPASSRGDTPPARDADALLTPTPPPRPEADATSPDNATRKNLDAVPGFSPQLGPLLSGGTSTDLPALGRRVETFVAHLEDLDDSTPAGHQAARLAPFLAAFVATAAALEWARRRRRQWRGPPQESFWSDPGLGLLPPGDPP